MRTTLTISIVKVRPRWLSLTFNGWLRTCKPLRIATVQAVWLVSLKAGTTPTWALCLPLHKVWPSMFAPCLEPMPSQKTKSKWPKKNKTRRLKKICRSEWDIREPGQSWMINGKKTVLIKSYTLGLKTRGQNFGRIKRTVFSINRKTTTRGLRISWKRAISNMNLGKT